MKLPNHGLVLPSLSSALIVMSSALAQAQSVTQFAPLDDSPIPTVPAAPPAPQHPSAKTAPATHTQVPQEAESTSAWIVNSPQPSPSAAANVGAPANTAPAPVPAPTVGSAWLGAPDPHHSVPAGSPTVTSPRHVPARAGIASTSEPPSLVGDSGLVFVNPNVRPERDAPEPKADEAGETHQVAATFSLARALLLRAVAPAEVKNAALYEGTIEVKVFERLSLAVVGGLGGFDVPLSQVEQTVQVKGKELGGQARVYVFGDFDHGLTIGGEYLRLWAEAKPIDVRAVPPPPLPAGTGELTGEATLSGLGAFVGYKITAGFGLTFDAKLGIQKLTLEGKGTVTGEIGPGYPTVTESESFRYEQLVPLVNVNLGWAI